MPPEAMMLEITGRRIQLSGHRPIAAPVFPVTVKASAFAVIEDLSFLDDLWRVWKRARECAGLIQFIGRHPRLHHVLLSSFG
jgi:hypothetical protein